MKKGVKRIIHRQHNRHTTTKKTFTSLAKGEGQAFFTFNLDQLCRKILRVGKLEIRRDLLVNRETSTCEISGGNVYHPGRRVCTYMPPGGCEHQKQQTYGRVSRYLTYVSSYDT